MQYNVYTVNITIVLYDLYYIIISAAMQHLRIYGTCKLSQNVAWACRKWNLEKDQVCRKSASNLQFYRL